MKLIAERNEFLNFIDWLPMLEKNECYYLSFLTRKKYNDKAKDIVLKNFTANSKEHLIKKIEFLEYSLGGYRIDNQPLQEDSYVLYISYHVKNIEVATKNLAKILVDKICNNQYPPNLESVALTEIHKANKRKCFIDFDFDNVNFEDLKPQIENCINLNSLTVLHTRGGFHLLVDKNLIDEKYSKTWYKNLSNISHCDQVNSDLIPIAGLFQGGKIVRLQNFK